MNQKKLGGGSFRSSGRLCKPGRSRSEYSFCFSSGICVPGSARPSLRIIVAYREENGRFEDRRDLLKVSKLGPKAFEQCAGFLRIRGGKNPLDGTSVITPESYEAAEKFLAQMGNEAGRYL